MRLLRPLLLASIAGAALTSPAFAQEDPRLNAIETQIRALQAELAKVRRDLNAGNAELRNARQARTRQTAPAARPANRAAQQAEAERGGLNPNVPVSNVAPPSTSAPPAPDNPGGLSFPKGRPTLTFNDGRFSTSVGLQLHYDVGGYFQGDRQPDTRGVQRLDTFGQNLRRARLLFEFRYDDVQVNVTPDFGGSSDGNPTLYEANINWAPVKPLTAPPG